MARTALLLTVALIAVWLPVETVPFTAVAVASAIMVLLPGFRSLPARSPGRWSLPAGLAVAGWLVLSAWQGIDLTTAVATLALLVAIVALTALAAQQRPSDGSLALFAVGLSLLTVWAVWQVTVGFDRALEEVHTLPEHLQTSVVLRLGEGRAFASLLLPSHLAVVLATALPLLLGVPARRLPLVVRATAVVGCVVGLALTRSPVGIALAAAACLVVLLARARRWLQLTTALAALALLIPVWSSRSDLANLEPVLLRWDNWKTALWLWWSAPLAGIGLGSYGQASQAVPFAVGNRPQHAHCLPLEMAAELGVVGAVVAVILIVCGVRLVRRLWRAHPAVAAAVTVIPAHNLLDFSLHTAGVALPWAVLLGWAVALARAPAEPPAEPVTARPSRPLRLALGGGMVALTAAWATSVTLVTAAAVDPAPASAFASARLAHRLAPWTAQPLARAARVALDSGDPALLAEARGLLETGGRVVRPDSALFAAFRAQLAVASGAVPSAVTEAWAAVRSQPANALHTTTLDGMLEELGSGGR